MTVLEIVVVVRTKDVGRNSRRELTAEFLIVSTVFLRIVRSAPWYIPKKRRGTEGENTQLVQHVDQPLAVRVTKVGFVRRTGMHRGLVDRVGHLVREDACRQAGDHLGRLSSANQSSSYTRCNLRKKRAHQQKRVDHHKARNEGRELTLCSLAAQRTLSLIRQLSRRKVSLYFMFLNSPPTSAARWITCVGWYLAKMAIVAARSLAFGGHQQKWVCQYRAPCSRDRCIDDDASK